MPRCSGLITTATHTAGVFALGGVTLLLSQWIVPDRLYPWLDLSAGLMVVGVGALVLAAARRHAARTSTATTTITTTSTSERRSLLAVGISGGLLPCPSALVVLLAAISLHRVAFGMLLVRRVQHRPRRSRSPASASSPSSPSGRSRASTAADAS